MSNSSQGQLGAWGASVCAPLLMALPVDGASVSLSMSAVTDSTVYASNRTASVIDDLQFDLGEGPRWVAARNREPVLLADVVSADHSQWPIFGTAVQSTPARSLFVFPMTVASLDIGLIGLYSSDPVELSADAQALAEGLVCRATSVLTRKLLALTPDVATKIVEAGPVSSRREIHQATGMVIAQTGMNAADALLRLRAHAFAHGQTLRETAHEVLHRKIDFSRIQD